MDQSILILDVLFIIRRIKAGNRRSPERKALPRFGRIVAHVRVEGRLFQFRLLRQHPNGVPLHLHFATEIMLDLVVPLKIPDAKVAHDLAAALLLLRGDGRLVPDGRVQRRNDVVQVPLVLALDVGILLVVLALVARRLGVGLLPLAGVLDSRRLLGQGSSSNCGSGRR